MKVKNYDLKDTIRISRKREKIIQVMLGIFFCLSFSHSVDMKCLVEVDQIRCSKLFEELYVVRRN